MRGEVRRLLLRAPNWLGDAVLSLPALRDLRRNFPAARLEVLARPRVAGLYEAVTEVDAVTRSGDFRGDVAAARTGFDLAVLFPNSFGSALAVRAAGVPERWGYATDGRAWLLTRHAAVPRAICGRSQVYYYRAMLGAIGLRVTAAPDTSLACPPEWSARGAALLADEGPWIGLSPGASFGSAKRWLPERYAAAADLVARRLGARVAILGAAAERPIGEKVASATSAPTRVLCGETGFAELLGVVSRLGVLVSNDSGPMHLAAALGVPVVAVFGPTDWRETAPAGPGEWRLVREPVHCSPCLLRECPIDHRCMRRVTAARVAEEAQALLGIA
ncbi:MAG TPA: lipopolysaccharide heptosyltransferase II [Vicinamibacteria bacterium]|nr:lipopolysaccharide heptosyltransferase II [Vicinamibacteria bacterium]